MCVSTYCGHDDDQELLALELLHGAHLDVRQARLAQQQSDLLTLGTNSDVRTLVGVVVGSLKCQQTQYTARKRKKKIFSLFLQLTIK